MNHKSLEQAFYKFQKVPFPHGANDDVVGDVQAEMAEYDGYIAGHIISYAMGKEEVKEKIIYDPSYEERLLARLKEKPELKEEIDRYLNYLNEIKKLVDLAHSE